MRSQLATLYRKLDVRTRDEAMAQLVKHGLVKHPPNESPGAS